MNNSAVELSDFQRLVVILKINLEKDNLTQMTCEDVIGTFPGPKSGFYIMRMNQCEVSDKSMCRFYFVRF